jgi:hypothetical protein
MPRPISSRLRAALQAGQTDEVISLLLTLTHPSFAVPIRVTDNGAELVSGGQTFVHFPFQVTLAGDTENTPAVKLSFDGTDRTIIEEIRGTNGDPIQVELSIVLASTPDTIEAGPSIFSLRNITSDAGTVTGDLRLEEILTEPYPADSFSPSRFPGCFGLASTQT